MKKIVLTGGEVLPGRHTKHCPAADFKRKRL